jgi:hypothetical protein
MGLLKYVTPSVGEKNISAEPKVDTALSEIRTVVNGELNSSNLEAGGVAKSNLSTEVKSELASFVGLPLESKKSIVATEQERESAAYGTLSTPDEVEVVLPANGLIAVCYQALWQASKPETTNAALFIGANQLKVWGPLGSNPETQAAVVQEAGQGMVLSCPIGLVGTVLSSFEAPVTSGQAVGVVGNGGKGFAYELGVSLQLSKLDGAVLGGPCYVYAAAGTYKISVKFRSSSGKVKVLDRKLWAWVIG